MISEVGVTRAIKYCAARADKKRMWLLTVLDRGTKSLRPRKDKRFIAETLTSPMGRVKDVSSSGVCIVGANRTRDLVRGKVTPIYLDTPHGRLSFIARVVWVRKTREGHEAGLSLLDVKPHVARLLRQLGELGFVPSNGDTQEPVAPSIPPELCNALAIAPDATDDEIMRAYRQTAMAYHPDRNHAGDAAERFQRAAEAYRKLKSMRPNLMRLSLPQRDN